MNLFEKLFQRPVIKREIDEELRFHIEQRTAENIAAGMPPGDAAREARKRFGNFQSFREECGEFRGGNFWETLWQDIQFGWRMLGRNAGVTAAMIATLALAIGATTVIYSFVHAILLRPLPYKQPERIVLLRGASKQDPTAHGAISLTDLADWAPQLRTFSELAYYRFTWTTLTDLGDTKRVRVTRVSTNFFNLLGVKPLLGRTFTPDEIVPGHEHVILVSEGFWRRELGGRPDVLGQILHLEGDAYTLVGIMPEQFTFLRNTRTGLDCELWVPAAEESAWFTSRRNDFFHNAIARLAAGATVEQAQAEMDTAMGRLSKEYPTTNADRLVRVIPLLDDLVMDVRPSLQILFAAVALVLLIACANTANMLLARAVAREREMAIRAALGAARNRIIRQLLTESVLLALLGGVLGVALAYGATGILRGLAPPGIPRLRDVGLDMRVLGFTFLTATLTGVMFGLVPAWHCVKGSGEALKSRTSAVARRQLPRSLLVIFEVALSVVLLIGAALLVRSLFRLQHVDTGFDPVQLTATDLRISYPKYPTVDKQIVYYDRVLARVKEAVPDSEAAVALYPPFGTLSSWWFAIEGREAGPSGQYPFAGATIVSDDYFRVMGTPIVRGRGFTPQDTEHSQLVVMINEAFARTWFPNQDPIGKRMRIESPPGTFYTIIGVVADARQMLSKPAAPENFRSYRQYSTWDVTLTVRSGLRTAEVSRSIREAVKETDTEVAIGKVQTLAEIIDQSVAEARFRTFLFVSLAGLALTLAVVGIYGVLAYSVRQQISEIGVRMALGAQRRDVVSLVIGQGLRLALLGTGLGLVAALVLTRLMKNLLFEIDPADPFTFVGVSVLLLAITLFASWFPARRAAKINPMTALRYE